MLYAILTILILTSVLGCKVPHRHIKSKCNVYPPVDAILTNLNVEIKSITNLAPVLQSEYTIRHPDKAPLKFSVHLQGSFNPEKWNENHSNYYVKSVEGNTDLNLNFRFPTQNVSIAEVLTCVSEHSMWNWWTYRDTIVIESNNPMFKPSLLDYDTPSAKHILSLALTHLFCDPKAFEDVRNYIISDLRNEKSSVLNRIIIPQVSLPVNYTLPDLGAPVFTPSEEYDLQAGELYICPHRILPRAANGYCVHLFVTGPMIFGGGWFKITFTKEEGIWEPKYLGYYDP